MADASQINQVVVNLCTNAWQGLKDNRGTLTIELKKATTDKSKATQHSFLAEKDYICLSITDTGIGMEA